MPFKPDGAYREFLGALWPYQYTPEQAVLTDRLANQIYDYSGGIPAYISKLLEEAQAQALMRGVGRIDRKMIAAAADYLDHLGGMEAVAKRERALTARLAEGLRERKGILLPASPEASCGIVSFLADGLHPFDAAALLDAQGIETRCGFHCAQPLMRSLGLSEGTVRISLGLYNTQEYLDRLFAALDRIVGRGRS